jgi:CO dehydrogenase/acetyl-CoA synthase alpha subunit
MKRRKITIFVEVASPSYAGSHQWIVFITQRSVIPIPVRSELMKALAQSDPKSRW